MSVSAHQRSVPIETVNPRDTSVTCRKCGQTNREFRDGVDFECTRCGYEVHADVNAGINLAGKLEI
ncbi:zinc ribbon domain-containing protein [Natronorubrum sp. A-ect3]|uniref:zinc ribbon domain-containing protein n=1 Tax=Natronorubrum sp. A-ect3 TaxID=3242698 RepID=UPI00359E1D84